jgi:hypothetical protein
MPPSSQANVSAPRIARGPGPEHVLTDATVGTAKTFLLTDSGGRCAYSMIHERECGRETIEVDHFDPRRENGKKNHDYKNLLPAYGPCNRSKSNKWPSAEAEAAGVRFLNPTVERDYGVHLFEDPQSHKIIGLTPAGKYHLRYLSLNTDYLVRKRANRSSARDILPLLDLLPSLTRRQREWVEDSAFAIPDIDSPPRSSE